MQACKYQALKGGATIQGDVIDALTTFPLPDLS